MMTHGSLFSGIGGFDLAAQWMGWENKFHCEWNEFGQKVLNHYWPDAETFTDITKSDFTKYANRIDVLTGGYSTPSFCAFSLIAVSRTPAIESPNFSDNAFRSESAFSDKVKEVFFLLMVVIVVCLRYIYGTNIINFTMGQPRNNKYEKAYSLYQSGLSLAQVAERMGVTRQGIFKAFKLRGYVMREMPERVFKIFDGKKFTLRNSGYLSLTTGERTLMHRYVWEYYNGPIPKGYDIHHINNCKTDNRIGNLECLPKSEHTRLYSPHNNQFTRGRKVAGKNL